MIYLDSCLLVYAIEKDAVFGDKVIDAIDSAEDEEFAISPLAVSYTHLTLPTILLV